MGKFVVLLALLGLASLCLAQTTLLSDMKLIIKDEPLPAVGPIEPAVAPVLVNSKVNAQALLKDYKRPIVKQVENQKLKAPGNASFIQFPSQYKLTAYLELPYASLVEPVSFFYDGVGMQQRIEYYDGTDVYGAQALQHNGVSWSSNPVINQLQCFFSWDNLPTGAPPQSMLTPFIPDLTGFSVLQQQVSVNGQDCWQLQAIVMAGDQGEVVNTYNLYVTSSEPYVPILYDMMGYDSLLHSHYDHYIVSYTSFEANPTFPANIFSVPTNLGACANQTNPSGPSIAYNDPTAQYRFLFPSNSVSGDLSPEYKQFTSVYGRTSGSDSFIRQRIFHNNNAFISAHNRQHKLGIHSYSVKLNHLADWNEHEMRALRGKLYSENAPAPKTHKVSGAALPINVDWRFRGAVSEVQDQAVCGSCWSFGSTGTITGTYAIKTGLLIDFSQQQLMDCSWNFGNNACNGGEDFLAYEYIMQAGGLQAMVDYGAYKGQDGFCTPNPNPTIKPAVIQSYVNLTGTEALLDAIYSQGPISVSINASPKSFSFYHSGVYANTDPSSPCPGGAQNLDHSVLAVGYGVENGQQYYLVKNSWSTYWGDEGYIKISTALDTCGVADMPTYVQLSL